MVKSLALYTMILIHWKPIGIWRGWCDRTNGVNDEPFSGSAQLQHSSTSFQPNLRWRKIVSRTPFATVLIKWLNYWTGPKYLATKPMHSTTWNIYISLTHQHAFFNCIQILTWNWGKTEKSIWNQNEPCVFVLQNSSVFWFEKPKVPLWDKICVIVV